MIWGDKKIKRKIYDTGRIKFSSEQMINPASINLRLGTTFQKINPHQYISLGQKVEYQKNRVGMELYRLNPGEFCLATTKEEIIMPNNAAAFVQGRSSIGRIGLTVQNAGFIDQGFHGHITLELVNESPVPIYLESGYPVAQLVFFDCTKVKVPYQGKYNGQIDATESRMEQDRDKYGDLLR